MDQTLEKYAGCGESVEEAIEELADCLKFHFAVYSAKLLRDRSGKAYAEFPRPLGPQRYKAVVYRNKHSGTYLAMLDSSTTPGQRAYLDFVEYCIETFVLPLAPL